MRKLTEEKAAIYRDHAKEPHERRRGTELVNQRLAELERKVGVLSESLEWDLGENGMFWLRLSIKCSLCDFEFNHSVDKNLSHLVHRP